MACKIFPESSTNGAHYVVYCGGIREASCITKPEASKTCHHQQSNAGIIRNVEGKSHHDHCVCIICEMIHTIHTSSLWSTWSVISSVIRFAAKLGDMPPPELNPDSCSHINHKIWNVLVQGGQNVNIEESKGKNLQKRGFGGINGVGMCARNEPRMVVMTYSTPKIAAAGAKGEDEDGTGRLSFER